MRIDTSVASIVLILGVPLLGHIGLSFELASNTLVRLALLLYVLYSTSISPLAGLLAVLAAVTVIGERNFRALSGFPLANNTIPYKKDVVFENVAGTQSPVLRTADSNEEQIYTDNNPRLAAAPTGAHSAKFFMDHKLSA
jgi:hypothetical protein